MAKTAINEDQLEVLLEHVKSNRNSARDRLLVILLHRYGFTVKELANLKLSCLVFKNVIKDQIKTEKRTIHIPSKAKEEIRRFISARFPKIPLEMLTSSPEAMALHVFASQKTDRGHFTRNTLNNYLFQLHRKAGISASVGRHGYLTKLSQKVPPEVFISVAGIRTTKAILRYLPTPVATPGEALEAMDA